MNKAALEKPTLNGHDAIDDAVAKTIADRAGLPLLMVALTDEEAELFAAYSQLDRSIFELHIQPLQRKLQRLFQRIEQRTGLPSGSIGTSHQLDPEARQAVPVQVPRP